jgi:DNA polymerase-3 subunit delta'
MAEVARIAWLQAPREQLLALRARGAHAMLLHGPAGVGKWDLAMAYAGDLLCESPGAGGRACGQCASCRLYAAGNHPDLRVVVPDALAERRLAAAAEAEEGAPAGGEPAAAAPGTGTKSKPSREIKIDAVRDLGSLFTLSAHRGGARVVVLGPAESLNLPAANALLKNLEEPPPGSVFLLVTDQIDRCLPTVLSRCALVRVPLPPQAQALAWLQAQGLAAAEAATRLAETAGAPLAVLRSDSEALEPELRAALLGLLRRGRQLNAADIAAEVPRSVPIAASVVLCQRWVWDYFAVCLGGAPRYHPNEAKAYANLAEHWSLPAAAAWSDQLRSLRALADHPLNPRAAVEGMMLDYLASVRPGAVAA